ncbi:MAG TPA: DNA adenine methylase, partial [Bacteroidia bacterium]|nr:DNA adenine methylase [Bacteroidia bacterium]
MRPPITYYGGKQKMLKYILPLIPQHEIYCEAFMGGGAVFFAKEPSKAEIINDINGNVSNFYRVVQSDFDSLKKLINGTLHSRGTYKEALA